MPGFPPTPEQEQALALFRTGESLAVEAGAGTGKTSTLVLLAEAAAPRRGQYVAFNKSIVTEAGEKFPSTVRCNTAHSLAFREAGRPFAHRLNSPRMKSIELSNRLRMDAITVQVEGDRKVLSASYLAGLVMRSVTVFCQTADLEPGARHVPYIEGIDPPAPNGDRRYDNNRVVAESLVPAMRRAWADLSDPRGQLPYSHGCYLKTWQLGDPKIAADFILFDEAQDANPVMQAIVACQAAQIVWVGDSQQQIYGFTGAINALAAVEADSRTFLTQSFRFGPAVAEVANVVLGSLKADLRLTGFEPIASVVGPVEAPACILTRTNATAVRTVLSARQAGQRACLIGGGREIVAFARAAKRLMEGERVDHFELACFESWGEVQDYVERDAQGGDLRLLVTLIDDFTVPVILEALYGLAAREADADLVVSTAHKAKGREWDSVQLASDFTLEDPGAEELRLLYVACTRAKLALDVSQVAWFDAPTSPAEDDPADAEDAPDAPAVVAAASGLPGPAAAVEDFLAPPRPSHPRPVAVAGEPALITLSRRRVAEGRGSRADLELVAWADASPNSDGPAESRGRRRGAAGIVPFAGGLRCLVETF